MRTVVTASRHLETEEGHLLHLHHQAEPLRRTKQSLAPGTRRRKQEKAVIPYLIWRKSLLLKQMVLDLVGIIKSPFMVVNPADSQKKIAGEPMVLLCVKPTSSCWNDRARVLRARLERAEVEAKARTMVAAKALDTKIPSSV